MWFAMSVACEGTSVIDVSVWQPMLIDVRPIGIHRQDTVVVAVVPVMSKVKHHLIMMVMIAMVLS
jgi:hypothetical protein